MSIFAALQATLSAETCTTTGTTSSLANTEQDSRHGYDRLADELLDLKREAGVLYDSLPPYERRRQADVSPGPAFKRTFSGLID
jgi:hypothetical protein